MSALDRLFGGGTAVQQQSVPGVPGVDNQSSEVQPEVTAQLLSRTADKPAIGKEDVLRAIEMLQKYKQGKANLEERIVQDELWWELRHWESIGRTHRAQGSPEPTSAWLFNAIVNKHADAMDNYPEAVVLPREKSDEESAHLLSEILPVVMEYNGFEQVYSDNWWEKLKHGTAAYGVFWNSRKENGLGDVDIRAIDLLKLFWEPGITDIQRSRNLFIAELVDDEVLHTQYPQTERLTGGSSVDVKQYIYDDSVDVSGKSVVVDWYYKVVSPSGKTLVHYAKFVGDELLYASENDEAYRERGFYDHGKYPVVLDVLFPEKGTPVGFGYVAVCKDPQLYIDRLSGNIMENAMMCTKKRFFVSAATNINTDDFLDWNKPLVRVEGELDERRIKEIECRPLDGIYVTVLNNKIEEMKDTASNRDVNSGGVGGGVTAASAIAALQEAGNKVSRDIIRASYRADIEIASLVIELLRQFYDEARTFRITAPDGSNYSFVDFSNEGIKDQPITGSFGEQMFRTPVFDLNIKAQKSNPFSQLVQNETAKELYAAGFFNPDNAQQSLLALNMMNFEGIDSVREQVMQGQTLANMCQQLMSELNAIKGALGMAQPAAGIPGNAPQMSGAQMQSTGGGYAPNDEIMAAQRPMTGYSARLAQRSRPDMGGMT